MGISEQAQKLHTAACVRQQNGYIDPQSGFFVLTEIYLKKRGACCGAGCRHCPYPAEEQKAAGRPTLSNPPLNKVNSSLFNPADNSDKRAWKLDLLSDENADEDIQHTHR